ncbi:MAG TPA: hypothetical protein DDY98_06915 [Ruminococcaceae bacterium]|nr:hypothetical protein [Oscillospiraceae bacterium]
MKNAKEQSPMKGQWPNPNTIVCKDCAFRDKTVVDVGYRKIYAGVTKSWCDVYEKGVTNGKPHDILFQNAECKYYTKDDDV